MPDRQCGRLFREMCGKEYAAGCVGKVRDVIEKEEKRMAEIEAGMTIRPGLDEILQQKGVE